MAPVGPVGPAFGVLGRFGLFFTFCALLLLRWRFLAALPASLSPSAASKARLTPPRARIAPRRGAGSLKIAPDSRRAAGAVPFRPALFGSHVACSSMITLPR
jgi:hypothetical protein